jgi:predicted O-methyltransferase YrrM
MLEIGSHLGASARYLAAGAATRGGRLYCIDTWQNQTMPEGEQDTYAAFTANVAAVAEWIVPVRKASEDVTQGDIPEPVHLAFIDGDHAYEAVRRDIDLVLPLMTDDPVIAFHDTTTYPGVARCLGEMLTSGKWKLGGHVQTLGWIVRARW